eukprot:gene11709-biopygen4879
MFSHPAPPTSVHSNTSNCQKFPTHGATVKTTSECHEPRHKVHVVIPGLLPLCWPPPPVSPNHRWATKASPPPPGRTTSQGVGSFWRDYHLEACDLQGRSSYITSAPIPCTCVPGQRAQVRNFCRAGATVSTPWLHPGARAMLPALPCLAGLSGLVSTALALQTRAASAAGQGALGLSGKGGRGLGSMKSGLGRWYTPNIVGNLSTPPANELFLHPPSPEKVVPWETCQIARDGVPGQVCWEPRDIGTGHSAMPGLAREQRDIGTGNWEN